MKSVVCVSYRNIADQETDFERGLGVTCSRADFTTHVDFFSRRYNFIDLDALLSGDLPDDPLLDVSWNGGQLAWRELILLICVS
jgi:hypothetical protein